MRSSGLLAASWQRVLLTALLACCGWLMDANVMATPLQVDFRDSDQKIKLAQNAQILEDASGHQTLEQVQHDQRWTDFHADALNFAFNQSTWWVRVRLRNAQSLEASRVLELGSALQDEIDVYIVRAKNAQVDHLSTGDRRTFDSRPVSTRIPSLPLHFEPGEQVDVYVKLSTHDGLHEIVAPTLWASKSYAASMQLENLLYGLYYGALLTGLLYHLFLFISTRQLNFGLYVLYVGVFLLWSLTFKGYSFQYFWPDSPGFNNQILAISASASYCFFALFMMAHHNTEHRLLGWMNRLMTAAIGLNALSMIPACFDRYALAFQLNIPAGIFLMLSTHLVNFLMLKRGSGPAKYQTLSFSALSLGVLLYYLLILGVVPSNALSENGLLFGSGAQILLLAFALADQMNQLKDAKLRAERAAFAAQAALNVELEGLVKRRTKALEAANQKFMDADRR